MLDGHHGRIAAVQEMLGRAITQIPGVLHVEGNRISTTQLVADVFFHQSGLDAEFLEALFDLMLEDGADVDLGDANVVVLVPLNLFQLSQVTRVQMLDQALGQDHHAIVAPIAQPLDDGTHQNVHNVLQTNDGRTELFGENGQGRASGLTDTQGQVARLPSHGHAEVPAGRGLGIHHQTFNDLHAHMPGGLITKSRDAVGQIQIVVDGLGHMHHMDAACRHFLKFHGRIGRVVATDGDQFVDVQTQQGGHGVFQMLGVLGGVVPGDADERAAPKMQSAHVFGLKLSHMGNIPMHDPLETVLDTHHLDAGLNRADTGRGDNAIDTGGRTACNQNSHSFRSIRHKVVLLISCRLRPWPQHALRPPPFATIADPLVFLCRRPIL